MGSADNNRLELIAIERLIPTLFQPTVILEVGSHNGEDCERLQKVFNLDPSNIYIVEAHPTFYKEIKDKYFDYNVYNFAASDIEGVVTFNAAKDWHDGRSSVLQRDIYEGENFEVVNCDAKRLDNFLSQAGVEEVDIFKLDVEGYAQQVLEGLGTHIQKIKCIQVETEYGQMWDDQVVALDTYRFLEAAGFSCIWRTNVANLQDDSLWVRNEIIESAL